MDAWRSIARRAVYRISDSSWLSMNVPFGGGWEKNITAFFPAVVYRTRNDSIGRDYPCPKNRLMPEFGSSPNELAGRISRVCTGNFFCLHFF